MILDKYLKEHFEAIAESIRWMDERPMLSKELLSHHLEIRSRYRERVREAILSRLISKGLLTQAIFKYDWHEVSVELLDLCAQYWAMQFFAQWAKRVRAELDRNWVQFLKMIVAVQRIIGYQWVQSLSDFERYMLTEHGRGNLHFYDFTGRACKGMIDDFESSFREGAHLVISPERYAEEEAA